MVDGKGKRWTLFRLGGVLGVEGKVRGICGAENGLKVTKGASVGLGVGFGEGGQEVEFVWVDEEGKRKVEEWVSEWSLLGNNKVAEGDGGAKPQSTSE